MSRPCRRGSAPALVLVLLAMVALPAPGHAQIGPTPPVIRDDRVPRLLAVGNLAFPAVRRPSLTGGMLWQLSLSPRRIVTEDGMQVQRDPSWYLHTQATAGVSFDSNPGEEEDALGFGAFGQLGLVRRIDPTPISSAGAALQGMLGPQGLGPVLRVELLDNIGIQLGWITFPGNDRKDGLFVSIDAMRGILKDLGLVPSLQRW